MHNHSFYVSYCIYIFTEPAYARIQDKKEIKIASWNLQNFAAGLGKWKLNDDTALQAMHDVITNYDVIFVQELQNKTNNGINTTFDGFTNLCNNYLSPAGYTCQNTPNIGTANGGNGEGYGEGYGVIYKKSLGLAPVFVEDTRTSTNPNIPQGKNTANSMVRPPMKATIHFGYGTNMTVFSNHDEYYAGRELQSGRYVYDKVEFDGLKIGNDNVVVVTSNEKNDSTLDMANLSLGSDSSLSTCNFDVVKNGSINAKENSISNITAEKTSISIKKQRSLWESQFHLI